MKILSTLVILVLVSLAGAQWMHAPLRQPDDPEGLLTSLGINANSEILESSGLAISTHVSNAIWTLNDSGHPSEIYLLKTNGQLVAKIKLRGANNQDWEAMAGFNIGDRPYLLAADVGDNGRNRRTSQIYILPEPNLANDLEKQSAVLPIKQEVRATRFEFSYEDGPKNCEAVAVDTDGKSIWLVEKVYYDSKQKKPPGIYVLPLSLKQPDAPLIAKRVANFPPLNVTGMAFSPDGKRLIIRNYINAHLYSREPNQLWTDVLKSSKPKEVVLPLQRQGEAICFSPDSKSVIVTSELKRQPIWQINLRQHFEPRAVQPKKLDSDN